MCLPFKFNQRQSIQGLYNFLVYPRIVCYFRDGVISRVCCGAKVEKVSNTVSVSSRVVQHQTIRPSILHNISMTLYLKHTSWLLVSVLQLSMTG